MMPKYIVDLPVTDDCKDCPFFGNVGNYDYGRGGKCSVLNATVYDSGNWVDEITFISEFPRPRNCPLKEAKECVELPTDKNGNVVLPRAKVCSTRRDMIETVESLVLNMKLIEEGAWEVQLYDTGIGKPGYVLLPYAADSIEVVESE